MMKSKLKRRLRKKLHVGEFQECGFALFVVFNTDVNDFQFDKFTSEFIDLIEENKLLFGGGGCIQLWEGFVTSSIRYRSPTIAQKDKIENWLTGKTEISEFKVGNFKDAWYDE